MSYILEALRKAQAERERGQVPGLDARSLADVAPATAAGRGGLVRWAVAGVGLGAIVLGGLGLWRLMAPQVPAEPPPSAAQTAAPPPWSPVAATPLPPVLPAAVPTAAPAPLPMVVSAPPELPAPAAPGHARAPLPASGSGATPAGAAIREARLPQLPPDLRRELPPLNVGGSMWSANAGSRFVIVDGQVLREGEPAAAGLVVERIGQKAAWLRWRDWRIELTF